MKQSYVPPLVITSPMLGCVEEIGELLGQIVPKAGDVVSPRLRRSNRIRTIHGSLAIEGSTLSLEQVTAIIDGKRVLGPPREVREAVNAVAAYDAMGSWSAGSVRDLLSAHALMMNGLVVNAGRFRSGRVGIKRGRKVVHVAPPAVNVAPLMRDLLGWLKNTDMHPLISSSVFHYEMEFIHPFDDGNGRIGRLWQTLVLSRWRQVFAWLPVESMVCDTQSAYYGALRQSDARGSAGAFVEFMLSTVLQTIRQYQTSDQVTDQVTDQVRRLAAVMTGKPMRAAEIMSSLGLAHRPTFRQNYLRPALDAGVVEMTAPQSPNSPGQRYLLTTPGKRLLRKRTDG